MKNKINIGIIGKNFGYNVIYKSFLKNKKFRIRGFAFKSKTNKKLKFPSNIKIFYNWRKLILSKNIDAIAIATPPIFHKQIIKYAIKNNKHIFCEKPFTCSFKDADIICNLIKKKGNISHMVNYEFSEINAFNFLKEKIINNIKIDDMHLEWIINIKKRSKTSWKENHSKGGGIMFNYVCHSIYYLEFLFGKINAVKLNIFNEKNSKIKNLKGLIFFKNKLFLKLNVKVGKLPNRLKPTHQLRVKSDKKNYILKSDLNSLANKFQLFKLDKNSKKILFRNKNRDNDFRIEPTLKNSKKFSSWILNKKRKKPNFYDATRIHLIIKKIINSSKSKKLVYID